MSTIAAGTTTNTALSYTGDTTGTMVIKVNDTVTALTLNTSGAVGVGTSPSYGSSGQVLTSAGSGAAPTWSAIPPSFSAADANTYTATQTFNGSATTIATVLKNAAESTTVSATAATGTINFDVLSQAVMYYTTNASGNWVLNVRGSSGTSLDTMMTTGQAVTIAFLVTNGATAYYPTSMTIDGGAVTPKWQGGSAPSVGNASSVDAYTYTIFKTGSATFTVFASQVRFA